MTGKGGVTVAKTTAEADLARPAPRQRADRLSLGRQVVLVAALILSRGLRAQVARLRIGDGHHLPCLRPRISMSGTKKDQDGGQAAMDAPQPLQSSPPRRRQITVLGRLLNPKQILLSGQRPWIPMYHALVAAISAVLALPMCPPRILRLKSCKAQLLPPIFSLSRIASLKATLSQLSNRLESKLIRVVTGLREPRGRPSLPLFTPPSPALPQAATRPLDIRGLGRICIQSPPSLAFNARSHTLSTSYTITATSVLTGNGTYAWTVIGQAEAASTGLVLDTAHGQSGKKHDSRRKAHLHHHIC